MARTPKRVASATGTDQSQAAPTGPAASTPSDSAAASGGETSDGEGDTSDTQGDSSPPAGDSAETSAPAPVAETPADASQSDEQGSLSIRLDNGDGSIDLVGDGKIEDDLIVSDSAHAHVDETVEVRVLVAYDDHLPNDVIVMDRAEAEIRLDQVDADPVAVAYAKSLVA